MVVTVRAVQQTATVTPLPQWQLDPARVLGPGRHGRRPGRGGGRLGMVAAVSVANGHSVEFKFSGPDVQIL